MTWMMNIVSMGMGIVVVMEMLIRDGVGDNHSDGDEDGNGDGIDSAD